MDEKPEGWNQELYEKLSFEYLVECGENERIGEWNSLYLEYLESEWKRLYSEGKWDPIDSVRMVVSNPQLIGPDFSGANFQEAHLEAVDFRGAQLESAEFRGAQLEGAAFRGAHLEGANFRKACLKGTYFEAAHLEGAKFSGAHLEGGDFLWAHLEGTDFVWAHLEEVAFVWAHLEGADFSRAHLGGADFSRAHLEGAKFIYSIVDGETLFTENAMDGKTDFTGTGISATRIDPLLRTKLEKNIREIRWKAWYKNHKFLQIIMRPFWLLTDYGASTIRPVCAFILWNTIFAIIYFLWLGNDFEELMTLYTTPFWTNIGDNVIIFLTDWMKSNLMIISLTDMATTKIEPFTLFFVFLHVFGGYFILVALVARLSIMFQNLSPNDE